MNIHLVYIYPSSPNCKDHIYKETDPSSLLRIIRTEESDQRSDIIHLSNSSNCRRRVNQRLHILKKLYIALEPLI